MREIPDVKWLGRPHLGEQGYYYTIDADDRDNIVAWMREAEAEIKRITEIADRRSCDSCGQVHDIIVMCPPHEVRIKGDCWYHKTIKRLQDDLEKLRWIPVAERLPEVRQWILCYWPSEFDKYEPFSIVQWWKHTEEELAEIIFTHWRYIILPEEQK